MEETKTQIETTTKPQISHGDELLKLHQDEYISFCAVGGVLTSDDGKITTVTQRDLATRWGVHPNTLTNWKKSIPNFAERVRQRRRELFSAGRETAAWNRLYVIGMTGTGAPAVTALTTILGHFGGLEKPVQRADVKVQGSLAELLSNAQKIVEGEVVDGA